MKALGKRAGVISVNTVFAALHIGWLSAIDIAFAFSIGLFFGYVVLRTGSIIGVSLSHGMTNVFLFLAIPSAPQIL